jgi:hypothetical protein
MVSNCINFTTNTTATTTMRLPCGTAAQLLVRERVVVCATSRLRSISSRQHSIIFRAFSSSPPPYTMTPPPPPSCPMHHSSAGSGMQPPPTQHQWWPEQQNLLAPLFRNQVLGCSSARSQTMMSNEEVQYRRRFAQLDLTAVERDLHQLMTSSKSDKDKDAFWPADYGHYGPFFIR